MYWSNLAPVPDYWSWLTPLSGLLFVLTCAGHLAWQVEALNWFLGWPSPRRLSRLVRKLNTAALIAGPVVFWWAFAVGLDNLWGSGWPAVLLAYIYFCWIFITLFTPVALVRYWLRPRARALFHSAGEVFDVAAHLGCKPVGRGKHHRLAHLPGNQIFQVEFNEKHLHLPQLPPRWDGLTILHLSDLHFRGIPDRAFYQLVLERCRDWQPDLVTVTGDIVDSHKHYRWVVPLLGRLRWNIAAFAILGNHDQWYDPPLIRRRLRRLGMHVLDNRWQQIDVHGQPLVVIGHEGPWFQPGPNLTHCPSDGFRLCLSHTPDNIAWARQQHIDLMLSGHNHGGQIRFPLLGSVYVPSRYSRRYDCGTFEEKPTLLHVSRGLGGQHPVRYNCRPEVTLLVLHSQKPQWLSQTQNHWRQAAVSVPS